MMDGIRIGKGNLFFSLTDSKAWCKSEFSGWKNEDAESEYLKERERGKCLVLLQL
jgi:hypothetical protein